MRRRSAKVVIVGGAGIAAIAMASVDPFAPRLLYNPSLSAPKGLYFVDAHQALAVGDRVAAYPPFWAQTLAAERGYLPLRLPVIKRIWAGPGDEVCRKDQVITAHGQPAIYALKVDSAGRPMPVWSGCITLCEGEYFLISNDVQGSFDGRYFGPVKRETIIGRVRLIWSQ